MATVDTITARQGDTLDELAWRDRGLRAADIGPLLALNPGLADLGPVLPLGTVVIVPTPATPAPATLDLVTLWD